MTPTALTPAARTKRPSSGAKRPSSGTSSPHPSAPRERRAAPARRGPATRPPRRISGPIAPPRAPRAPQPQPQSAGAPLGVRALRTLRRLPDHVLLDRVVRGRLWIPLLGVLLAGIVAMQVEVLKLNASIGHAMVRASQLQSADQLLRATDSQLSDDQRIESAAAQMGMSMPAPSTPQFLDLNPSKDLARALGNLREPDPGAFALQTSAAAAARAASVSSSTGQ